MKNPSPRTILNARKKLGITQAQAAELLHCHYRTWEQWEAGKRKMHPAFWELWRIKVSGKGLPLNGTV